LELSESDHSVHGHNNHVDDVGAQQAHQSTLYLVGLGEANPFDIVGGPVVRLKTSYKS